MQRPPVIPTPTPETRKWSDIGDQTPSKDLDPTFNSLDANGNLLEGGIPVSEKRYNNATEVMNGYIDKYDTSATSRTRLLGVQPDEHIRIYYKQPDGSILIRDYISPQEQRMLQFVDTEFAVTNGNPEVVVLRGQVEDDILNQMIDVYDQKIGLDAQNQATLNDKSSSPATEYRTATLKGDIHFTTTDHPNAIQREIMGIQHPNEGSSTSAETAGEQLTTPTKNITEGDIISDTLQITPTPRATPTLETALPTPQPRNTETAPTQAAPDASTESTPETNESSVITDFHQLKHEIKEEAGRQYLYLTIPAGMDALLTRESSDSIEYTLIDQVSAEQGGVDIPLRIQIEGNEQQGYNFSIIASSDQTTDNPVDTAAKELEQLGEVYENITEKETSFNDGDVIITTTTVRGSTNTTP